jgi:hypothetical protein
VGKRKSNPGRLEGEVIKATGKGLTGRNTLFIGLSHGNLDKFRDGPLDSYILIDGKELGLSHDVMIFSGRTEADMSELLLNQLVPGAKVHVSERSKN